MSPKAAPTSATPAPGARATTWQRVAAVAAALLMLGAGVQGLVNALGNLGHELTGGQWAMTVAQLGYALATPLLLVARWRLHPALIDGLWAWGAAFTLTALLAPVVWGGASWWVAGVAGAGGAAGACVVAALLVGGFRPLLAPSAPASPPPTSADRSGSRP
jgi:hypothetical protein